MGTSSAVMTRSEVISQNEIIRRNISAITEAQKKEEDQRTLSDRISDAVTRFSGSMSFVWIHAGWFSLWILLNVGLIRVPLVSEFDPFPFGLLTMVVSLEAIFLSTFVLISQNRMARLGERRAELDLHINLLAEQKATKVLEMLDQIARQLDQSSKNFNFRHDPVVEALKVSPEPQEVLDVMKDAIEREAAQVKEKVGKAVEDITGEMDAVRKDVREITGEMEVVREEVEELSEVREEVERIDSKIETMAGDVHDIKDRVEEPDEEAQGAR